MTTITDPLLHAPLVGLLAAAGCGALVGLGVWIAIAAVRGQIPQRLADGSVAARLDHLLPTPAHRQIAAAGLIVAVAAAVLLRMPTVGALIVGMVGVGLDLMRGPSMTGLNERGAGVAAWTETVRQELEAGQPQKAALMAACDLSPPGLEAPLAHLSQRLETGTIPEALWAFAREVRHPASGHVVAALNVAYQYGAANLPSLMAAQVETTRHQVQMTREIHAARAKHRRTMLLLLALFVSVILILFVIWPDFLSAYRDGTGQLVLLAIGATVLVCIRTLGRLSRGNPPPDFFTGRFGQELDPDDELAQVPRLWVGER
jgi:Flp pilus assembly protein TadB